eukprot:1735269-Prymnesium_polylepis.1
MCNNIVPPSRSGVERRGGFKTATRPIPEVFRGRRWFRGGATEAQIEATEAAERGNRGNSADLRGMEVLAEAAEADRETPEIELCEVACDGYLRNKPKAGWFRAKQVPDGA